MQRKYRFFTDSEFLSPLSILKSSKKTTEINRKERPCQLPFAFYFLFKSNDLRTQAKRKREISTLKKFINCIKKPK